MTRICFVADARSPIAQNWIRYFAESGCDVHIVSTYPCEQGVIRKVTMHQMPLAFARLAQNLDSQQTSRSGKVTYHSLLRSSKTKLLPLLGLARDWVAPLEVLSHVAELRSLLADIKPDLVHAMRIPFEGVIASRALPTGATLLVSVWGNDFTLHARSSVPLAYLTRACLQRCNALHCDCHRDLELARAYGFDSSKPSLVVPTAGGIQRDIFYPSSKHNEMVKNLGVGAPGAQCVINPRGFRGYVRNDTFFRSIPKILVSAPNTIFVCPSMAGNKVAERWAAELNITHAVKLLPKMSRSDMADLYRAATVTVSPSTHDGTPNTLLEAMACGCYPVVSNIETMHEWITEGVNGSFFDVDNPDSLAEAVVRALANEPMHETASAVNQDIIESRANYTKVMKRVEDFYSSFAAAPVEN